MNINTILIALSVFTGIAGLMNGHTGVMLASLGFAFINAMQLYHDGSSKLWDSLSFWTYLAAPACSFMYFM